MCLQCDKGLVSESLYLKLVWQVLLAYNELCNYSTALKYSLATYLPLYSD